MINDIESDLHSTTISFPDFLTIVAKKMNHGESSYDILDAFKVFDQDGNGFISVAEMRHVLMNIGEKVTDDEVDEMLRDGLIDNDGKINYAEFVQMMLSK